MMSSGVGSVSACGGGLLLLGTGLSCGRIITNVMDVVIVVIEGRSSGIFRICGVVRYLERVCSQESIWAVVFLHIHFSV